MVECKLVRTLFVNSLGYGLLINDIFISELILLGHGKNHL